MTNVDGHSLLSLQQIRDDSTRLIRFLRLYMRYSLLHFDRWRVYVARWATSGICSHETRIERRCSSSLALLVHEDLPLEA